jgi:hypothetical protein
MATDAGIVRVKEVADRRQGEECAEAVMGVETARGTIVSATVEKLQGGAWRIFHYVEC